MKIIEFTPNAGTDGRVKAYIHEPISEMENRRRAYPSVVLCPGGAYCFVSGRESDCVAMEYLAAGYNVFILTYSVGEKARDFTPLRELSATVMAIRENAEQWACDEEKIAVCGFSAGGHLAASLCTLWNHPKFTAVFDTRGGRNRPAGAILAYPVISAGEFSHGLSLETVSGGEVDAFFSLESRVTKEACPVFIWHTAEDDAVPVENTLLMAAALQKNKIPFECHIFPTGGHGISVCTEESGTPDAHNRQWVQLSKNWLNKLFDYKL